MVCSLTWRSAPRIIPLVSLAVSIVACNPDTESAEVGEPLTQAHRAALADTLRAEADKLIQALADLDGGAFGDLFTDAPDFTYIDQGNLYPDKATLVRIASGFFGRLERIQGHWNPTRVAVLAPDAGVFSGVFHADRASYASSESVAEAQRGQPLWTNGMVWTLVYRRADDGGWEIVQAQQASLPEGRIDQHR